MAAITENCKHSSLIEEEFRVYRIYRNDRYSLWIDSVVYAMSREVCV
jgi:hypothetical protein